MLAGAGAAFCAGYDLTYYAQAAGPNKVTQDMPWDPMKDYAFMMRNTELFMSLWRSYRPVICKVHGYAVAGGSDIALCADMIVMAEDARIGYMPVRVWGCPTTAMWVYRLGPERAKRMLFTGDKIDGREAEKMGRTLRVIWRPASIHGTSLPPPGTFIALRDDDRDEFGRELARFEELATNEASPHTLEPVYSTRVHVFELRVFRVR